jgi:single-stranded DNA-binding protein
MMTSCERISVDGTRSYRPRRAPPFRSRSEKLPQDLGKGERVYCEGRLTLSHWEKGGVQRTTLRVAESKVMALDRIARRRKRRRRPESQPPAANHSAGQLKLDRSRRQFGGNAPAVDERARQVGKRLASNSLDDACRGLARVDLT